MPAQPLSPSADDSALGSVLSFCDWSVPAEPDAADEGAIDGAVEAAGAEVAGVDGELELLQAVRVRLAAAMVASAAAVTRVFMWLLVGRVDADRLSLSQRT
jgi:hypothetical protein